MKRFLQRLADRLVLCPSTYPIDPGSKKRELISVGEDSIEIWTQRFSCSDASRKPLLFIKFPGTGGRAELASVHPAELFGADAVIWTVNPFGYGGSDGPATMQRYPEMVDAIGRAAAHAYPNHEIVVVGNSLGGMSALAFAAKFSVAAMLLRNPAPLYQLIRSRPRYAIPTLGLSRFVAAEIPDELDAVENAAKCSAPCLMVSSQQDRVVPASFQDLIAEAYAGDFETFKLPQAGHADPVPESLQEKYVQSVLKLVATVS